MSWWDIPGGLMGDEGADLAGAALLRLGRPTPAGFLAALATGLAAPRRSPPTDLPKRLRLKMKTHELDAEIISTPAPSSDVLTAFVDQVGALYQRRWERPPTTSEILMTISFVLGASPSQYLMWPAGEELIDLVGSETSPNC